MSRGVPGGTEIRWRTALRTSRGITDPDRVRTGWSDASPSSISSRNPSAILGGSARRHRTFRTPWIVRGRVAGSECRVYTASNSPSGSGNRYRIGPDPAGTSFSSPSSNTTAGAVNSSRIVSAEYGMPNSWSPSSIAPSRMSIESISSNLGSVSLAMMLDRPGQHPTPATAGTPAARNRSSSSSWRRVMWYRPPRSPYGQRACSAASMISRFRR